MRFAQERLQRPDGEIIMPVILFWTAPTVIAVAATGYYLVAMSKVAGPHSPWRYRLTFRPHAAVPLG